MSDESSRVLLLDELIAQLLRPLEIAVLDCLVGSLLDAILRFKR